MTMLEDHPFVLAAHRRAAIAEAIAIVLAAVICILWRSCS
jgi:hypothetical protein